MKWGLKKPTDKQLREQIADTRVSMYIYLVLFGVSLFFGAVFWPTVTSVFLLYFAKVWLIIVCVMLVSQKQDKIRLEIRELKK